MLDDLCRDLRYAIRSLRRTPGFTVAAILTLALGVGGNTAIFSIVRALLLQPLPYADAERLMILGERWPNVSGARPISMMNFLDWAQQNSLGDLAGLAVTAPRLEDTYLQLTSTNGDHA